MKYSCLSVSDVDTYDFSFWQSKDWYDILLTSRQADRVFFYGKTEGTIALVEVRSIGVGMRWAFILGITPSQFHGDSGQFYSSLCDYLAYEGVVFLQIEPLQDTHLPEVEWSQIPYRSFITPYTRTLDLTYSEDEILNQMNEKWRYNIRLAQKRSVTVECVEPTTSNLDVWMSLLADTTSRDRFAHNSRLYYESFLSVSSTHLYFAHWQGRVIAAGIWAMTPSRAIYYYGASTSDAEARKQMAPYLLQWRAIQDAKKMHIPLYDFLGVADPHNPHDPLQGVSQFKSKFGGTLLKLPKKILVPLSKKYTLFRAIRNMRSIFSR